MITFYIKFGSLPCWLTLEPLRALAAQTGVSIEWQPLLGSLGNVTGAPAEDDPLAEYKARRAKARSQDTAREHERMCSILGIDPEKGNRLVNPLNISLGMRWLTANNAAPDAYFDYANASFELTFIKQEDVESLAGVCDVLTAVDVAVEGFEEFAAIESGELRSRQDGLLESGILNAPAFIVDGDIFHGREHLPLITWMLEGRSGHPPV